MVNNNSVGKSMILAMSAMTASMEDYRVGVISPEMSVSSFAYRTDSFRTHFSNMSMQKGLLIPGYAEYFEEITHSNEHIFVADSNDFGGDISVTQCKNFVKQTKIDILFIDGLVYVKPDGYSSRMSMTDSMGKTGQQLLSFSNEAKIPIVAVVQAQRTNRGKYSSDEDDISTSENIFGSYQLTQAATRIVSVNRSGSALRLFCGKNRYGKDNNGEKNGGFLYNIDFDRMTYTYIPGAEDIKKDEELKEIAEEAKDKFKFAF